MTLNYIPKYFNEDANDVAQLAYGYKQLEDLDFLARESLDKRTLFLLRERITLNLEIFHVINIKVVEDWKILIINYLINPKYQE